MAGRARIHIDNAVSVGKRIREAREQAGLTQRDIAFAGCSAAYLSRIESGARAPSLQVLRELARRVGVSEAYLAWGQQGLEGTPTALDPVSEAELALRFSDLPAARLQLEQIIEQDPDQRTRARALAGLGQIAIDAGDPADAIQHFEAALEQWPSLEDQDPSLADSLGRAYAMRSEYESAIAIFERRLAAAEARQDLIETIRFSVLLANTLVDRGLFARAEELLGHALAISGDLGDPVVRARLWWTQSRLHALQNDSARAERYARLALDTLLLTEHVRYAALAHQVLAHIKLNRGEAEEGLELLDQGWPLIVEGGNDYELGLFQIEKARALAKLGRLEEGQSLAEQAGAALLEVSREDSARALMVLAEIHHENGAVDEAIAAYRRAADAFPGPHHYKIEAYTKLGELLKAHGRKDEALEALSQALRFHNEAAAPPEVAGARASG
jgi:tetratricopeptide (TPR) repeat protein